MLLPDFLIAEAHNDGIIVIDPWDDKNLQPASYDLCVDSDVKIAPKEFVLLSTLERIELPNWLQGQIHGRSSTARKGLMVHISAGFVDPGFRGTLTLETVNFSKETISLTRGQRICQIAFLRLLQPAKQPYQGKYQDQQGATPTRNWGDRI